MGITFEKCGREVKDVVERMINENHQELLDAGVTVECLFANVPKDKAGEPMQDAIKLHGYPCLAVIRITPYKKRVQGLRDAEITIDHHWWENASETERDAIIDHELTHLLVVKIDGEIQTDDCHRPKLKMRLHDKQIGIFKEVIQRHGMAAVDAQVAKQFTDEYGQFLMEFAAVG